MKRKSEAAMSKPKVLVIGLDGATLDLIEPWTEEGKMPTVKGLMKTGTYGNLRSAIPPISPPAWVSFYTGKNPGKHGIYSFTTREGKLIDSRFTKGKKIWQIFSDNKCSCCVVNAPITYPPEDVNGCMIAGFLTPPGRKDFVLPSSFVKILEKNEYRIDLEFERHRFLPSDKEALKKRWDLLSESYDIIEKRYKTVLDLLKKRDWDLFLVVFRQTDVVQHLFWDRKDILLDFYQKMDGYIGEVMSHFKDWCCGKEDEVFVILLSDHGFGPRGKTFNICGWVKQQKFIDAKARALVSPWDAAHKLYSLLHQLIPLKTSTIQKVVPKFLFPKVPFEGEEGLIYIDRTVKDYEPTRRKIIEELQSVKEPLTGRQVFRGIWKGEEVYKGPCVEDAPDIVFVTEPGFSAIFSFARISEVWLDTSAVLPGDHLAYSNGLLILNGPHVRESKRLQGANIVDVTPTILYLTGLPVLKDMDGKILRQAINSSFLQKHPIKYQMVEAETEGKREVYTREEEEKIKERLKSLGYFG